VRISGAVATLGGVVVMLAGHPLLAMAGFGLLGPNASQAIAGVATVAYTVPFILVTLLATGIAAFSGVLRPAGVRDAHLDG
jgi:hypothetical protein